MSTQPPLRVATHKPYYAAIDGVRAICVLLVMLNHLKTTGHIYFLPQPHLGVDIFFIISGFLITGLLCLEQKQTGKVDFGAFYWRRAFRIIPVYSAVLLLYVAVCQLPSMSEKWVQLKAGMPWFLTFMNEFAVEPNHGNVFTHTWSLGIEEKFYLFWPLLFFLVAKTTRMRAVLVAIFFAAVCFEPFSGRFYHAGAYYGLLMGSLTAFALSSSYRSRIESAIRRIPAVVMAGVFVGAFYLEDYTRSVLLGFSVLISLFMVHIVVKRSWLSGLLGSAPMVWLGKRSYSMYLVHVLCLNAIENRPRIENTLSVVGVIAVSYALTALVAECLYRTVEEPARRGGKQFLAARMRRLSARQPALELS